MLEELRQMSCFRTSLSSSAHQEAASGVFGCHASSVETWAPFRLRDIALAIPRHSERLRNPSPSKDGGLMKSQFARHATYEKMPNHALQATAAAPSVLTEP